MITILVGRDGRPSMKVVYSKMKSEGQVLVRRIPPGKKAYIRVYEKHNIDNYKKAPVESLTLEKQKVIRWGNRIEAETSKDTIVYNKAEAIANATDKKLSREIFIKNKVRCPLLVTPSTKEVNYPVIARPSRHAKGRNFVVLNTLTEFTNHYNTHSRDGWYYSNFVNKEREFRVHCAHGKVLAVMEKARGGDKIAWNRAVTGEPFTRVEQANYIRSVCFQALKAVKSLGLDFAGVDVLLLGKEGYVLEVNTSPTLNSSDFVSERYALYFDWLNRSDKRREHWDFTKFENPVSFAWKNFQLMDTENPKAK
jgi:carbamoylphosphate synthase large subunit